MVRGGVSGEYGCTGERRREDVRQHYQQRQQHPGRGREVRERSAGACTQSPTKRQVPQALPLSRHSIKMLSGAGPRERILKDAGAARNKRKREVDNGIASPREKYKTGEGGGRKGRKERKVSEERRRAEASHSAVGPEHDLRSNPVWTEATLPLFRSRAQAPPRGAPKTPRGVFLSCSLPLFSLSFMSADPSTVRLLCTFGWWCRCRHRCCSLPF